MAKPRLNGGDLGYFPYCVMLPLNDFQANQYYQILDCENISLLNHPIYALPD